MGSNTSKNADYDVISSIDIKLNNPNQLFTFFLNRYKIGTLIVDKNGKIEVNIRFDDYNFYFENCSHQEESGILYVDLRNKKFIGTLFIQQYDVYNYKVKFAYVANSLFYSGDHGDIDILMVGPNVIE